jgi:hypothetical protein
MGLFRPIQTTEFSDQLLLSTTPAEARLQLEISDGERLVAQQGVIQEAIPTLLAEVTWDAAGVDFTSLLLNVTDTASGVNSRLLSLNVDGVQKCGVTKDGVLEL